MRDRTEEKFLEAIASDASDDTRLVYADWLLERGDPRAEYVRLEHRLHNLPDEEVDDPFHIPARERLLVLEQTLDGEWISRLKRGSLGRAPPRPVERATISLPPPPPRPVSPPNIDPLEPPRSLVPTVSQEVLDRRVVCAGCSNVMAAGDRICPSCGRDRIASLRLATLSVGAIGAVVVVAEVVRTCG